jgi:hypothetical protein
MAARLNKWTPEIVRRRIQTAHIVAVLQKHIRGKIELSTSQVRAAEVLLRKTLPDQTAITHSGEIGVSKPDELSDNLLAHIASSSSDGVIEAQIGKEVSSELH